MIRPSRALAALAVSAVALLSLSGCMFTQIPSDDDAGRETPSTSPSPTPSAADDEPTVSGATLTFDEGNDLAAGDFVQWSDGFITDENWKIESPDDGNGSWTYRTVDGTCSVKFWQGTVGGDVTSTVGDDSASTDALMAFVVSTDVASITAAASDGSFSYQLGGSGSVDSRQVAGGEGDRKWLLQARSFSSIDAGLWRIIDCKGGDPAAILADVDDKSAVVVMPAS